MASRARIPSETDRQWYIGTSLVKYRDAAEEHYAPVIESASRLHVSFTDLVLFSLIAIFWGIVFFMALQVGL